MPRLIGFKPVRLACLKLRTTIANGIARTNVPTVAIVIPLSKKYFYPEFVSFMRFVVTIPSAGGNVRGVYLSTEKQGIILRGDYLVVLVCPKKIVRHRATNLFWLCEDCIK